MGLEVGTFVNDLVITNPVGATDPKSQGDDHLRLLKTTLKNTFPGAVGALKFESTDAGAAAGPLITLHRNSASPAAADVIGGFLLAGEDSAGNETNYANIIARIDDPTNGSEDGSLLIQTFTAGVSQNTGIFSSTGLAVIGAISGTTGSFSSTITGALLTLTSTDAGAGTGPSLVLYRDSASPAANDVCGQLQFDAEDSLGNRDAMGAITMRLDDPTSGSEDTSLEFRAMVAGSLTELLTLDAAGTTAAISLATPFVVGQNAGSAAAPTLRTGNTTTGLYGSVSLEFAVSGVNKASLSSAGNFQTTGGYIGTTGTFSGAITAPSLDVTGSVETPLLTLEGANGIIQWEDETTMWIRRLSAGVMQFVTAGVQRGVFDTTGLAVNGAISATSTISTSGGHVEAGGAVFKGSATTAILGTLGPTGDAGTIFLRSNGYNDAANQVTINSLGNMTVNGNITSVADGIHTNNKIASDPSTAGVSLTDAGQVVAAIVSDVFFIGNRITTDGSLMHLRQDNITDGTISTAAGVVTYGTFFGSHWSQPAHKSDIKNCLRGTIVDSTDELCFWEGEAEVGQPNLHLPKFEISRKAVSDSVYGVIAWQDEDGDWFIGSLGAFMVRVQKDEKVKIGDYIESAGNGCGRVQEDKILRASTVAKVTSTKVAEIYSDGSYLVPCTLHCG